MNRGRPKKIKLSPFELHKVALDKYKNGDSLSLEETAYAMWNPNNKEKPMSEMGILKMQNRALSKIKNYLSSKHKINSLSDILNFNTI